MKKLLTLVALLSFGGTSYAQETVAPPKFVPFTVTEQDTKSLEGYLQEQPFKFSAPIMQWLGQLEQRALAEQSKKSETKPTAPVAPTAPPAPAE